MSLVRFKEGFFEDMLGQLNKSSKVKFTLTFDGIIYKLKSNDSVMVMAFDNYEDLHLYMRGVKLAVDVFIGKLNKAKGE